MLSLEIAGTEITGKASLPALSLRPSRFALSADEDVAHSMTIGVTAGTNGLRHLESAASSGAIIPTVVLTRTRDPGVGIPQTVETIKLLDVRVSIQPETGTDTNLRFDASSAEVTAIHHLKAIPSGAATESQPAIGYRSGTRLATASGTVIIEDLQIGDVLKTAGGALRQVRWLGHRRIDCARHSDPMGVRPIRIAKEAIASDVPSRDLWVSPQHGLLLDGRLIPAGALVNGSTIVQSSETHVDYWQVEFDTHDTVVAEGLAAESYQDIGNRSWFVNGGAYRVMYPEARAQQRTDTVASRVCGGPLLEAQKRTVLAHCAELGHVLTDDADLHLMADDKRVDPIALGENRVALILNEDCSRVELRCRSFVPTHIDPTSMDSRSLGVCVTRLELNGDIVNLDNDEAIGRGWHWLEQHSAGQPQRWTSDRVEFPAGTKLVLIERGGRGYYWAPRKVAPLVVVNIRAVNFTV